MPISIQNPLTNASFRSELILILSNASVCKDFPDTTLKKYASPILEFVYHNLNNADFNFESICMHGAGTQLLQSKLPLFLAEHLLRKAKRISGKTKTKIESRHMATAKLITLQLGSINTAESHRLAAELSMAFKAEITSRSSSPVEFISRSASTESLRSLPRVRSDSKISSVSPNEQLSRSAASSPETIEDITRRLSRETALSPLPPQVQIKYDIEDFVALIQSSYNSVNTLDALEQKQLAKHIINFKHKSAAFSDFPEVFEQYLQLMIALTGCSKTDAPKHHLRMRNHSLTLTSRYPNATARICVALAAANPEYLENLLPTIAHFLDMESVSSADKIALLDSIVITWPIELKTKFGHYIAEDMQIEVYPRDILQAICRKGLGLTNDFAHMSRQHKHFIRFNSHEIATSDPVFSSSWLRKTWGSAVNMLDPEAQELLACATFNHNTSDPDDTDSISSEKPARETNLSSSDIAKIMQYQMNLREIAIAASFQADDAAGCFVPRDLSKISPRILEKLNSILGDISHSAPIRIAIRKIRSARTEPAFFNTKARMHYDPQLTIRFVGDHFSILYGFPLEPQKTMLIDHYDISPLLHELLKIGSAECEGIRIIPCTSRSQLPPVIFRSRSIASGYREDSRIRDEFPPTAARRVASSPQLGPVRQKLS